MAPLYIVLIIIIFIWSGIFGYMLHLEKQIRLLRESIKKLNKGGVNLK